MLRDGKRRRVKGWGLGREKGVMNRVKGCENRGKRFREKGVLGKRGRVMDWGKGRRVKGLGKGEGSRVGEKNYNLCFR